MHYTTYLPSVHLRSFVRNYWVLDINPEDVPYMQQLLPFGRMELFFFLNEPFPIISSQHNSIDRTDGIFSGFHTQAIRILHLAPFRAVGISLQPWASHALFNIPAHLLSPHSVSLKELDPSSHVREHLLHCTTHHSITHCLEHYIQKKITLHESDPLAQYLSIEIIKAPSASHIYDTVIPSIGLSKRRIEQRFRSSVGVNIGDFCRINRFDKSIAIMSTEPNKSLTQIGLESHYYDQSHFIREFKRLSDQTPGRFLKNLSQRTNEEIQFLVA